MFICSNCGYGSASWIGRCPQCNQWDTMKEQLSSKKSKKEKTIKAEIIPLKQISLSKQKGIRKKTNIYEFDRVIGNGFVPGEVILLSGEPGIGKSTLLLQAMNNLSCFYISGEESAEQVKNRVERLKIPLLNCYFSDTTQVEGIISSGQNLINKLDVVIIDSIQTLYSKEIESTPGTISQIKATATKLIAFAKKNKIPLIIVGHITKDKTIAGPKTLEHMVDCVLLFEGEQTSNFRVLRATKNRFGSTDEIGLFQMDSKGLKEVVNPLVFLDSQANRKTPGKAIVGIIEGKRPLFLEVQCLAVPTILTIPRRVVKGVNYNKVLLLLAVIRKHLRLSLEKYDLYINVIGGVQIRSTAADLGIVASIISSLKNISISTKQIFIGEVGLLGDVRKIPNESKIIKEAQRLGFKKINYSANINLIKQLSSIIRN